MARTAVSRMARAGCSSGKSMNWVRISGDALNSSQLTLSPLTAMDDWVLLVALMVPLRRPSQLGQLQFHWGNPPPAAEPSTRIRIAWVSRLLSSGLSVNQRKKAPRGGFPVRSFDNRWIIERQRTWSLRSRNAFRYIGV